MTRGMALTCQGSTGVREQVSLVCILLILTCTLGESALIYSFQPVGLGVCAGARREVLYWTSPNPSPAPRTTASVCLSADLPSAAIGWQFGDRLGVALGAHLGGFGLVLPRYKAANPYIEPADWYLTALDLGLHVTDRLGSSEEADPPMLVASLRSGLALQNPGPGWNLFASLAYEWTWARVRLGLGLRYLDIETYSLEMDYAVRRTSYAAGLTVGFGGWHSIGHR